MIDIPKKLRHDFGASQKGTPPAVFYLVLVICSACGGTSSGSDETVATPALMYETVALGP